MVRAQQLGAGARLGASEFREDAVAAKDGRKPRLPLGWVNPFDAEDPDAALLEIGDKLADGIRAEIYGGQIQRDVLARKKAVGTPRTGVEIREPVHDRRLGCDGEGR